jgi:probable rRNA maturation factor
MFTPALINHPEIFTPDLSRIEEIFQLTAFSVDISQQGIVNIAFLPDPEIQLLNKEHRGIDTTTDVLSFHYAGDFSLTWSDEIAWEVIMSESRILAQSLEYGHSTSEEFEILLIHSLLHLLGYDHEEDEDYENMFAVEKEIREKMWLNTTR